MNAAHLRRALATLTAVQRELEDLSAYWDEEDLPDDFLGDETYPFTVDLDSQITLLEAARESLQEKLDRHERP